MKTFMTKKIMIALILTGFTGFSPLFADAVRKTPIEVNLIVDGSAALSGVIDDVSAWISGSLLAHLLVDGDRLTIWSAGSPARIVFSETLQSGNRENVLKALRGISPAGNTADFAGALREAAFRKASTAFSYTLLVSASVAAFTPVLQSPEARLMRFSRTEEFRGWRAMVIGLNLDSQVRQAAAVFMGT
jgi:hypothetical protein